MKVTYQIVTKARTPVIQVEDLDRSVDDEEEFQRVAVNVMRGVDAGAFPPVRGWQCRSCPYSHACRAAGEAGKESQAQRTPRRPIRDNTGDLPGNRQSEQPVERERLSSLSVGLSSMS